MPINPDLLALLVCPACHGRLEPEADGTGLKCVSCRLIYPIRDDIPVMMVDEAIIENDDRK